MIRVYKERSFEDTIGRIQSILKKARIDVEETLFESDVPETVSARVYLKHVPTLGANGKGNTYNEALAGAYGELIERLQNRCLFFLPNEYKSNSGFSYAPDEKWDIQVEKELESILTTQEMEYISKLIEASSYGNISMPYYSISNDCVKWLPMAWISNLYGSNGMCAGNTFYEAYVNGICEIMERYVCCKIVREKISVPTVLETGLDLCIENKNKILSISKKYQIEIKDCSLGEGYPVIGVCVIDRIEHKYIFKIASHPDIDVAISKAINEILQGNCIENNSLFRSVRGVYDYYEQIDETINYGIVPYYESKDVVRKIEGRFINGGKRTTNKEMYLHLKSLVENAGLEIFVRDVSFMGFPAFQIIVPHMSEIYDYGDIPYVIDLIKKDVVRKKSIRKCIGEGKLIKEDINKNLFSIFEIEYDRDSVMDCETILLHNIVVALNKNMCVEVVDYMEKYCEWLKSNKKPELHELYSRSREWMLGNKEKKEIEVFIDSLKSKKIPQCILDGRLDDCSNCMYGEECYEKEVLEIHDNLQKIYIDNCLAQGKDILNRQ